MVTFWHVISVKKRNILPIRPVARISKGGGRKFEKLDLFVLRCVEQDNFVEPPPKKGGLGKILKTEMLLDALWCVILSKMQWNKYSPRLWTSWTCSNLVSKCGPFPSFWPKGGSSDPLDPPWLRAWIIITFLLYIYITYTCTLLSISRWPQAAILWIKLGKLQKSSIEFWHYFTQKMVN